MEVTMVTMAIWVVEVWTGNTEGRKRYSDTERRSMNMIWLKSAWSRRGYLCERGPVPYVHLALGVNENMNMKSREKLKTIQNPRCLSSLHIIA